MDSSREEHSSKSSKGPKYRNVIDKLSQLVFHIDISETFKILTSNTCVCEKNNHDMKLDLKSYINNIEVAVVKGTRATH